MSECECKRKRAESDDNAIRATHEFKNNLTYSSFVKMCQLVYNSYNVSCDSVLMETAANIPLPDLRRILTYIKNPRRRRECNRLEIYADDIIEGHMDHWTKINDERIAFLLPLTDKSFWELVQCHKKLRSPVDMSIEQFRTLMEIIVVQEEEV